MGNVLTFYYDPETQVLPDIEPTFDPHFGFKGKRKIRQPTATKEELMSAKVPLKQRDYCAHHILKFQGCSVDVHPLYVLCGHHKHNWFKCQEEDLVLRMKEYEREKRLRARERRINEKQRKLQEAAI